MKTQECKEFTNTDKGIAKEMLWRKFESNEIDGQIVLFESSFYCFEQFNCFEISKLEYLDVILSTERIFPSFSTFWPYFDSSLSFIPHCNVHLDLNSFWKKESMLKNIKSMYLVNANDRTDCHPFFSNSFDEKKRELFVEKERYFCSHWIEMERVFGLKTRGSYDYFVLKVSEITASQILSYSDGKNENENESIVSEKDEIRELLKLSGGSKMEDCSSFSSKELTNVIRIKDSDEIIGEEDFNGDESLNEVIFSTSNHLREIDGFSKCTSLCRIEIPSSVEKIGEIGFSGCTSLNEIIFSPDSHLKEIDGFGECTSLCRIEVPLSVEKIGENGFSECKSLNEIVFSSDSHLREIHGFGECTSLCRIEIPSSVEVIGNNSFLRCTSLKEIVFSSGSHLREIDGFGECTSLCRIEIPSLVEIIGNSGFYRCTSLNEIVFSSDSHLREMNGFRKCTSLCRIESPSSVEQIRLFSFYKCMSLRVVVIRTGCRPKSNKGFQKVRPFLVYEHEDEDMKHSRRQIHLGIGGRKVLDNHLNNSF
jgi:hypothetical protein